MSLLFIILLLPFLYIYYLILDYIHLTQYSVYNPNIENEDLIKRKFINIILLSFGYIMLVLVYIYIVRKYIPIDKLFQTNNVIANVSPDDLVNNQVKSNVKDTIKDYDSNVLRKKRDLLKQKYKHLF